MKVVEHSSEKYSPRTYHNAKTAQLTVAFANDFTTAGERLTKKAAGDRYVAIYVGEDVTESARTLFKHCRHHNTKILNVAGNGIYSLSKLGWTQRKLNKWVHDVIALVHKHWELEQNLYEDVSSEWAGVRIYERKEKAKSLENDEYFVKDVQMRNELQDIIKNAKQLLLATEQRIENKLQGK